MIPSTIAQSLVSLLLLVGDEPAAGQTYYQAPIGVGAMIPRNDLILPFVNTEMGRQTKELMNDANLLNDQAFLGMARSYSYVCDQVGNCGSEIARLILSFTPKINGSPKLIFEQQFPKFHLLTPAGGPIWIGYSNVQPGPKLCATYNGQPCPSNLTTVANDEHATTRNLFMGIVLPWPNVIPAGQLMEVLIDGVPGLRNRDVGDR